MEALEKNTVVELKKILKTFHLKTSGNKKELVERIFKHQTISEEGSKKRPRDDDSADDARKTPRRPIKPIQTRELSPHINLSFSHNPQGSTDIPNITINDSGLSQHPPGSLFNRITSKNDSIHQQIPASEKQYLPPRPPPPPSHPPSHHPLPPSHHPLPPPSHRFPPHHQYLRFPPPPTQSLHPFFTQLSVMKQFPDIARPMNTEINIQDICPICQNTGTFIHPTKVHNQIKPEKCPFCIIIKNNIKYDKKINIENNIINNNTISLISDDDLLEMAAEMVLLEEEEEILMKEAAKISGEMMVKHENDKDAPEPSENVEGVDPMTVARLLWRGVLLVDAIEGARKYADDFGQALNHSTELANDREFRLQMNVAQVESEVQAKKEKKMRKAALIETIKNGDISTLSDMDKDFKALISDNCCMMDWLMSESHNRLSIYDFLDLKSLAIKWYCPAANLYYEDMFSRFGSFCIRLHENVQNGKNFEKDVEESRKMLTKFVLDETNLVKSAMYDMPVNAGCIPLLFRKFESKIVEDDEDVIIVVNGEASVASPLVVE
eukprot:GHVL01040889.1.p1 GENE.GHVL01040889.1~~GHVL01040889.1.p1  ORF type:complete len:551 (-),score=156.25 GHVL01040889.1:394-2046(-)